MNHIPARSSLLALLFCLCTFSVAATNPALSQPCSLLLLDKTVRLRGHSPGSLEPLSPAITPCLRSSTLRSSRLSHSPSWSSSSQAVGFAQGAANHTTSSDEAAVLKAYSLLQTRLSPSQPSRVGITDLHQYRLFLQNFFPALYSPPLVSDNSSLLPEARLLLLDELISHGDVLHINKHQQTVLSGPLPDHQRALATLNAMGSAEKHQLYSNVLALIGWSVD